MNAARSAVDSKLFGPSLLAKHGVPALEPCGALASLASAPAVGAAADTLAATAARLPAGRTKDIADAIIALLRNGFITGTVLHADRGHRLV
ncbi:hypothetical protein ACIBG5_18105 [Kribbella sp. NPDC050241]|uniref:hypothetical protein n=1 Tax=Kribbella sp. NPDC050241 TaxID=3364115 RepID=UPI00378FEA38